MLLTAAAAVMATTGVFNGSDVDLIEHLWSGVHDSAEQVFQGGDPNLSSWAEGSERRVRTVVAKVSAPWLGPHVLYLEEFLHDDPDNVRRQLLLRLEPAAPPASAVRVEVFLFRSPAAWIHLDRRPRLIAHLNNALIEAAHGCDLLLRREGDQFVGGTQRNDCSELGARGGRYVDFRIMIGDELYWYRRRVLRRADDALLEEVIGFNWFELNEARLFSCRVEFSSSGRRADLRPLLRADLHDQGGRVRLVTPDGRKLELTLHSQDWPFMADRDALILLLTDPNQATPLATAWADADSGTIGIDLGWLKIQCGSIVPDTDELWAAVR